MADLGDLVPLATEIRDASGALVNATTIALTIGLPDGTTTSPAVANPPTVTGKYSVDYSPVQVGRHTVTWLSTGPQSASRDVFDVNDGAHSVLSLAGAKKYLNIPLTETVDDEEILEFAVAATMAVERHRQETIPLTTYTETLLDGTSGSIQLDHRPLFSLTSITVGATPQNLASWQLNKPLGQIYGPALSSTAVITYVAGRSVVPPNYVGAIKVVLGHLWETQRLSKVGQAQGFGLRSQQLADSIITPSGIGQGLPDRAIELLGTRPSMIV